MITKVVNKAIDIVKKFCIKFSVATVNVRNEHFRWTGAGMNLRCRVRVRNAAACAGFFILAA